MNDCKNGQSNNCCEDCTLVEGFRSISQKYQGIDNDAIETIVQNKARTIEIKLKPQQYQNKDAFPSQGNSAVVYIDTHNNESYRWDEQTNSYICIGSDWHRIKIIDGGESYEDENVLKSNIKLRNGTSDKWTTSNPILLKGEIGIEIDTHKIKIGDGATNWNDLQYIFADILSRQEIIDLIHPINSVMVTANDVNPADLIGGVWRETKIIAISELKYWVRVE